MLRRPFEEFIIRAHRWLVHVLLRALGRALLFVTVAVIGGAGSAFYMIDVGNPLTTQTSGPWTSWTDAGRAEADPYTIAHFKRAGLLPLPWPAATYYFTSRDSHGSKLYGDCEYEITGVGPPARWWSLAVFSVSGALLDSPAGRWSITSPAVMRDTSGQFTIRLAPEARPGNWLPVTGSGGITLVLTAYGMEAGADRLQGLPRIERVDCR
jgi:hypothetical protein